ncbi:MAG: DNA helicase [Alphaproteobacteria bacterium]|nr:MAG: DNA helicase [Alphaproteobacteria bacterium]
MNFEELGLSAPILEAIKDCGYDTPTPIQEKAIPHILMARDVVGLAQTGTGKTAGFTLPMIEILAGGRAKARMPRSLILSPTRELAAQIAENFDTYGKNSKLTKALLVGGSSMAEQIKILDRGADVLIATPGRLIDLFERGKILLNDIKILVIDEADRMLDMGFIPDIEKICSHLPPIRQTLLFSATMAPEIKKLTEKFLINPREVAVSPPASTAVTVQQFRVNVSPKGKNAVLEKIIKQEKVKTAFIFCNRKRDVDSLSKWLQGRGHDARPLHGDMAQVSRTKTLEEFKAGKIPLLVCSDVAARGIDVASVSHVFNYDVPGAPDDYVHRVGRTGRAGETGRAWMLVTKYDDKQLNAVIKRIGKEIEVVDMGGERSEPRTTSKDGAGKDGSGSKERSKPQSKPRVSASKPAHSAPKSPNVPQKKAPRTHDTSNDRADSAGFGDDVPDFFK